MAFGELKKVFFGFSFGLVFIILSGLLTGGILFADFLLNLNVPSNFLVFGVPYGIMAGLLYFLLLKSKGGRGNVLKKAISFGIGFWLSFSVLYVIMYLAFSRFQGL